jgi:hypothetical protein
MPDPEVIHKDEAVPVKTHLLEDQSRPPVGVLFFNFGSPDETISLEEQELAARLSEYRNHLQEVMDLFQRRLKRLPAPSKPSEGEINPWVTEIQISSFLEMKKSLSKPWHVIFGLA